ncbi:MAG: transglutaminase domain-containing protein [Planctomycetota bacterium]
MKPQVPRAYVAARATQPPTIDGRLNDAAWANVPWTADFVDIEGDARPRPTHRTRAKMLWDEQHFYVAAQLDEPHVWAQIREHDAVIFHDNDFELFVDPDGDNHQYYEFEMNALNTGWDLFLNKPYKDGGQADDRFELTGLRSAVHIQGTLNDPSDVDQGWSIEIAIPWTAFNRPAGRAPTTPQAGERWRVNFSRVEWATTIVAGDYQKVPNRPENNWIWSPQGIVDMHRPERWGTVEFSAANSTLEVTPTPDPQQAARDLLMEIYHRQRSYQAQKGTWSLDLAALGMKAEAWQAFPAAPILEKTESGYRATLLVKPDGQAAFQWCVTQDSQLTRQPAAIAGTIATTPAAAPVASQPDSVANEIGRLIDESLQQAGKNRMELERALRDVPATQREGLRFLIAHMPQRDRESLTAEYLLENTDLAYRAFAAAPWKKQIPPEIFLNDILPYASINERRDRWRRDFYEKCLPLVKDARSPGHAAALLNQKIYGMFNVRYSTKRNKADQSPYESIETGLASCSGLTVLLIDACRAVGVPARFCGTPLWSDRSGNHSWVEVWDDGWHFTGAAEPSGDQLDSVWFGDRASAARRDDLLHAIYSTSFKRTPQFFPMVWARDINDVSAVNVTDRYTSRAVKLPEGAVLLRLRAVDARGERVSAKVQVLQVGGEQRFDITTNDERFDANDHRTIVVQANAGWKVTGEHAGETVSVNVERPQAGQLVTLSFTKPAAGDQPADKAGPKSAAKTSEKAAEKPAAAENAVTSKAVTDLGNFLAQDPSTRGAIQDQPFARLALTKADALQAKTLLIEDHKKQIRASRAMEMKEGKVRQGDFEMPFTIKVFGEKPEGGRSLVFSMHGGGGAPKAVNDSQWENQKRLYTLKEGVYVVPRAPTDTWNLWHQDHIDPLFDRLIENLVVFEDVNPNRVYLMGYSAGGDGVYQLAPRMADRFAAAAMMAGHPNETSPLGLRNLPFTIHMGGKDAAYNRNQTAADWAKSLAALQKDDPKGYTHLVKIHPDKGHWMDREDAVAIPWMYQYQRAPLPERIVWKQDDVTHRRFYWLALDDNQRKTGAEVIAVRSGQKIDLQSEQVERLRVRLNDEMLDLDQPVTLTRAGEVLATKPVERTIATLARTLSERGDPFAMYSGEVEVILKKSP